MSEVLRGPNGCVVFIFVVLFLPIFIPLVGASTGWEEDGWLDADWFTKDGRIASGDELGCQGMPTLNLKLMPRTTAMECKKYLMERTNASRWSDYPLSFGVDMNENPNFDSSDHEALFSEGFAVHGLNTNYFNTAWHDASDIPVNNSDWWNLGSSGSLEQKITSLEDIVELAENGAMVNLQWQARIADLRVRTNGDLVAWLESQNSWYTTWGEAYSYEFHRIQDDFLFTDDGLNNWKLENLGPPLEYQNSLAWNVPVTRGIEISNSTVVEVSTDSKEFVELSLENKTLKPGWRYDGNILWITINSGEEVTIKLDNYSEVKMLTESARYFNNHSWALTISGHHTIDLFKWSMKFDESPLVFTWLVEPQEAEDFSWILILIAATAGISAVIYSKLLISKDREKWDFLESE